MSFRLRRLLARLAAVEIWIILPLAAASLIASRFLLVVVIAAVIFWVLRLLASGRSSARTPSDLGILILVLTLLVSIRGFGAPDGDTQQALRLLAGIALYYAVINWGVSRGKLSVALTGVTLASLLLAVYALFSVAWAEDKLRFIPASIYEHFRLIVSDAANPNVMGGTLAVLMPLVLAQLLFRDKNQLIHIKFRLLVPIWGFILPAITLMAMSGVLLLTQSRSAILAILFGVMLMGVMRWRFGWIGPALLAVMVGIFFYLRGSNQFVELFLASGALGSIEDRLDVWSRSVLIVKNFPYTGIGMGNLKVVADTLYPFSLALPGNIQHAHNIFLQIAVDLGIPGLIAWISIWLGVMLSSVELFYYGRKSMNHQAAGLAAGIVGSQIILILHGLTDSVTWGMVRPAPLVWLVWAIGVAGSRVYLQKSSLEANIIASSPLPKQAEMSK